mmetsp:Transcript_38427/g.95587  ORF Transcript_38427/g.95587 Transcript_38427/m.95587 type:complete len:480 (-) Transcript_38427:366-1805(-)
MNSGDRRPTKDMRRAHKERLINQIREAPQQMEIADQEMAGQRRERKEAENDSTPPPKQVRNEEEQPQETTDPGVANELEQMYIENDAAAYSLERELEKQRKFHFQQAHAQEETKLLQSVLTSKGDNAVKIKLSAAHNKHAFRPEAIASQVLATLLDVDIEIEFQDIIVTPMSATGPYVVALHKEAAEYLLEDGVMLADTNEDPPITQFFSAKPYNLSPNAVQSSNTAEDIALSIYFNLSAEYTGMKMNQLVEPKERIQKALTEVFGEPSDFVSYVFIQPKSPMGFYRNAIRAIVKYNKQNEDKVEPKDVNDLAKIRFVGMGFGKRPVPASMATGWRAAFGIEQCCFRQKEFCTKLGDKECDLREKVWAKFSYNATNQRSEFAEKKRKREEEQKTQRERKIAEFQQLQMERTAADCCSFFLQGKCSKTARDCPRRHRSLKYSKHKITCASAKPRLGWICAWTTETCPYAHHIDATKDQTN